MRKFLPYILIITILVQLLAPFSVGSGIKNKAEAADNCKFETVSYTPKQDARPYAITITLKTSGCVGELVKGVLTARHATNTLNTLYIGTLGMLDGNVLEIPEQEVTSNYFSFRVETGENGCGVAGADSTLTENLCLTNYTFTLTSKTKKTELSTISSKDFLSNDQINPISFNCATENCGAPNQKPWKFLGKTDLGTTNDSGNTTITQNVWYFETTVNDKVGRTNFQTENLCNAANKTAKDNYNSSSNKGDKMTIGDCQPGQVTQNTTDLETKPTSDDLLPGCSLNPFWGSGTVMGCVAQILYYVLFVPTSYVFALTGTFFDFTFHYSIQDTSYRTPFVVEGWGIVRDMCNMFFIFILLYIAFGTILNLHSVKTKEMIINVVIIGLLINFSLFATQVMIDASNILARVFYNSDSIKITQKSESGTTYGTAGLKIGPNGEIPLSAAIVNKVNPQNLIINGRKSVVIQDNVTNESSSSSSDKEGGLGVGAFILITLLATAVNIVGMLTFLSVGLIFVARVIGLWFAMIFSPFVFFSYTVPSLQDMEMVGWKKWWPETLKLAFLAPIFIFFMYLIIAFLEKGLSLVSANKTTDGMTFVISIIIPFIFIMLLLMKAKDIAKDMSGKLGQSITGAVSMIGGVALGGAALGTAALGRKFIGGTLAKASRGDTSTQKYAEAQRLKSMGNTSAMDKLNWRQKAKGATGKFLGMDKIYGTDKGDFDINTHKAIGVVGGIGGLLNKKQKEVGDIDHARHEVDEAAKAAGVMGKDGQPLSFKQMSGEDVRKVENKYKQTKQSDADSAARKGVDAKGNKIELAGIAGGENAFKVAKRKDISDEILADDENRINGDWEQETKKVKTKTKKLNPNTNLFEDVEEETEVKTGKKVLTKQGEKKLEDKLSVELNTAVKIAADQKLNTDFAHIKEEAATHVKPLDRIYSGANKSTYDVRKLSDIKSDKREGFFGKVPVALIAGIATGVRAGMKNVGVSNGGIKVEGNFMKDLGNTISDSVKSMKVNVDLSHVGETKSSADAHGGDHGGGHH